MYTQNKVYFRCFCFGFHSSWATNRIANTIDEREREKFGGQKKTSSTVVEWLRHVKNAIERTKIEFQPEPHLTHFHSLHRNSLAVPLHQTNQFFSKSFACSATTPTADRHEHIINDILWLLTSFCSRKCSCLFVCVYRCCVCERIECKSKRLHAWSACEFQLQKTTKREQRATVENIRKALVEIYCGNCRYSIGCRNRIGVHSHQHTA